VLAAFLTAALWSIGAVSANRGARLVGGLRFNLVRLLLAVSLLGTYAHVLGGGLAGVWMPWFLVSGVIGFGIGDLAGYRALAALGSRLAVLVIHCAAMPLGALLEWAWLGTRPAPSHIAWSVVIAAGLVIALAPSLSDRAPSSAIADGRDRFGWGVAMCLVSAVSQAFGAVTSRKAFAIAASAGGFVDAITAAYQRCLGGVLIVIAFAIAVSRRERAAAAPNDWRAVPKWLVIHTLAGPVIGVACFQWALSTTPAALVLPILATIPLIVTPLSMALEGERPSRRSLAGAVLSVGGACALAAGR
jgi:drug/metabolite transporter (DMT)-like permease